MMRFEFNKRLSRALAVALLIFCILLLLTLVIVPVVQYFMDLNRETAESFNRYDRYRSVLAARMTLEKSLAAINSQNLETYLYFSNSPTIALSTVHADARRIIEGNGGKIDNSTALDVKEEKPFLILGSKIEFKTSVKNFTQILYGLEVARPILRVDTVHIFTDQNQADDQEPVLRVRMSVYGYMRWGS